MFICLKPKSLFVNLQICQLVIDMANGKVGNGKVESKEEKEIKAVVSRVETKLKEIFKAVNIEQVKKSMKEIEKLDKEIEELQKKMEELKKKRAEHISLLTVNLETVDIDFVRGIRKLGINGDLEIIEKAYDLTFSRVHRAEKKTSGQRAKKGEGLSGKKVIFQGKTYNIASYFARKMGIEGGMEGLKRWAEENGYKLKVEGDTIIIE